MGKHRARVIDHASTWPRNEIGTRVSSRPSGLMDDVNEENGGEKGPQRSVPRIGGRKSADRFRSPSTAGHSSCIVSTRREEGGID